MNKREREQWARYVGNQRPEGPDESKVFSYDGSLPSKANRYEVRFDPELWKQLDFIVQLWRKQHPNKKAFWIAPAPEVKLYQTALATYVGLTDPHRYSGDLSLAVTLTGQRIDIDNIKAVADAMQESGLIQNDNQFVDLRVTKQQGKAPSLSLRLRKV